MHKDIEKILYSEKDIENIVNTIAKQIEKDAFSKGTGIETLILPKNGTTLHQGQRCLYG